MSGKSKADYRAVFRAVLSLLPPNIEMVESMVDFEAAIWLALKEVFPRVIVKGCAFHWKQAVWRHIQHAGLQRSYMEKDEVFKLLRRLMALPCLPKECIAETFMKLKQKADTDKLKEVFNYVQNQWIDSTNNAALYMVMLPAIHSYQQ
ncbi:uncharacterized protein [Ptychodera flava]|uniref:uncharacterized protein n=1 Tax=Ptychodera flava TaxID=63121 RepID=UPI00396A1CF8